MRFKIGDHASISKTITEADIALFVAVSGDTNPLHTNAEYAKRSRFGERIAHGSLTASLISNVIGTKLPGVGAVYLSQTLKFIKPVKIGDTITATATLTQLREDRPILTLRTICTNQKGETVLEGEAHVLYDKSVSEV
ncbi:MAG: MaoC family dehydratase [Deinococcus sp.]|nr:MaoC family dehydratase [Deinococcus sp.]